jgi:hypothetical protein
MARPRGKSSSLGEDIRGDTSAPAMSTMNEVSPTDADTSKWEKVWLLATRVLLSCLSAGCLLFPGAPALFRREAPEAACEAPQTSFVAASLQRYVPETHMAPTPPHPDRPSVRVCRQPHAVQPDA